MTGKTHRNSLRKGHLIGSYEIIDILGQGGFGITYLAMDVNLNRKVAIKEFLPVELAVREDNTLVYPVSADHREQFNWGLERFISEAQTLARFKHPNIVSVLAVVKENNTAYIVMDYEYGHPFSEMLKGKKTIEETRLKNILFPIMDGLEAVHNAGFIHRDIKPPNIYIRDDQSPVLIDFGSARQSLLEYTRTLTTLVSPGFAPFEQYVGKSDKQGPWTDIYGLGATLYRAVTGLSPADSMERSEALLHSGSDVYVPAAEIAGDRYSPEFLAAIDKAMAFKTEDRPQSMAEWHRIFKGGSQGESAPQVNSEATTMGADVATVKLDIQEKPGLFNSVFDSLNRLLWKAVGAGLILIAVLVIVRVILPGREDAAGRTSPSPAAITRTAPPVADDSSRDSNAGTVPQTADKPSQDEVQINPEPEEISDSAKEISANEPVTDQAQSTSRIPLADRQRLQSIRSRLRANRQDRQARRELRELAGEFEQNIKQAVNNGEYDLARAYLYEVQQNTDRNTQAYRKLDDLLTVINKLEKTSPQK